MASPMQTVVDKTIGGRAYVFRRTSASDGLDLQLSLLKVGASELASFDLSKLAGEGEAFRVAFGVQIAEVIGRVAAKLTKAELLRLMGIVFQHTSVDGRLIHDGRGSVEASIDLAFPDRPLDLWQAFIEALKVNLGPLFAGLRLGSSQSAATQTTP